MLHQIGAGALGPVFRAYQPEPGRLVAVKLFRLDLPPERAHKLVAEFERLIEADLSHPGIASPIGTGLSDVAPYLAQDFVTADSLDVVIRAGGSSSPAEVGRVAAQLGAALDYAAERGVLHGALHPRDVMLSTDDVRVTGLGVARALEQLEIQTPVRRPYSAPERAVGGPWDGRADMFSFAALMFELLFLRRVSGSGDRAVVSLPEVPGVSRAALKKVFAKALSADPNGRFLSGTAFADALQTALNTRDAAEVPLPLDAPETASAPALVSPLGAGELETPVESDLTDDDLRSIDARMEELSREHEEPRIVPDEFAPAVAAEEVSVADDAPLPKRGKRKSSQERMRASMAREAEAADAVRAEDVIVPPVFTGSPAEEIIDETALVADAAVDPTDLHEVEEAAQGIQDWLDDHHERASAHPGGAAELPLADVAAQGHEHDPLELQPAAHGTLFDEHPLDLRQTSELAPREVAAVRADTALPVDHDLAMSRTNGNGDERSAAAFASMALETTRTAIWPLLLAAVVGGAIVLGVVAMWYVSNDSSSSTAPVVASAPPPTRIEDPALVLEGSAPPHATPGTTAPPATTPAPVVSEPMAPRAPRTEAAVPSRPTPNVERPAPRATVPAPRLNAERQTPPRAAARQAPTPARGAALRPAPEPAAPVALIGSLRVESRPAGATVVLDGRRVGVTPLSLNNLEVGDHPIALELQGFRRWATSVKIVGGQQVRVGASLEE